MKTQKSQITMKDLAKHFDVSLSTVHKAIAGKPGVSEATRQKIVNYANANGYKLNTMASSLKRKTVNLAVCFPEAAGNSRYYYKYIWNGYRKYMREWQDLNIRIKEIPFKQNKFEEALLTLEQETRGENRLDGLLTVPPADPCQVEMINRFSRQGTAVVFVTGDNPKCSRLGCVEGDYYLSGRLMAEQICNMLPPQSRILLVAGNPYQDAHYLAARGFHECIGEYGSGYQIQDIAGCSGEADLERQLAGALQEKVPDGICCVFTRGSALLLKVMKGLNLEGKIPVIANDVFDISVEALKKGAFTNLVFKDPYKQSYLGMKMLCEYLVQDVVPRETRQHVETVIVFRNNVNFYWEQMKDMEYMRG